MCICFLVALFVHEKDNYYMTSHMTDHCISTRVLPVTDICQLKDHLQTKGQNFL